MVSRPLGLEWILLVLGTFTGLWFLYVGIFLTSVALLTALFALAGVGMLVIAWTRAFGPSFTASTEERMRPATTRRRLVTGLLAANLTFSAAVIATCFVFGVGPITGLLAWTIGLAMWLSSTLILWRSRRHLPLVGRGGSTSSPP
jgi:hypothetical protein